MGVGLEIAIQLIGKHEFSERTSMNGLDSSMNVEIEVRR
jgi:hypothetical protein